MKKTLDYVQGTSERPESAILENFMGSFRNRSRSGPKTAARAPEQSPPANQLAFLPSLEPRSTAYAINRSLTNDPATAMRVNVVAYAPDLPSRLAFTDNPTQGGTYYYWASALAANGGESARIGMGQRVANFPTVNAATYPGADWGLKVKAAIDDLPNGGIVDARGFTGTQVLSAALSIGSATAPIMLLMGAYQVTSSALIDVAARSGIVGMQAAMGESTGTLPPSKIVQKNSSNLSYLVKLKGAGALLEYLGLDGNKANNTTTNGVSIAGGKRSELRHVTIVNCPGKSISIVSTGTANESQGCRLFRVMAIGSTSHGLYAERTTDTFVNDCEFENTGAWGVYMNASTVRMVLSDSSGHTNGSVYVTGLSTAASLNGTFCILIGNGFSNNAGLYDVQLDGWDAANSAAAAGIIRIIGNDHAGPSGDNTTTCVYLVDCIGAVVDGNTCNSNPANRYNKGIKTAFVNRTAGVNAVGTNLCLGSFPGGQYDLDGNCSQINCSDESGYARNKLHYHSSNDFVNFRDSGGTIRGLMRLQTNDDFVLSNPISGKSVYVGGGGTTDTLQLIGADTKPKRIKGNGTSLVSGDFTIGAGYGTTASLSGITGTDIAFTVTVTANGTGLALNPTLTLTFRDGTWTNSPIAQATQGASSQYGNVQVATTPTTVVITLNGITPIAGDSFVFHVTIIGR